MSGVSGAGPASRRSSFAASRRRMSGVAVGVAVRSSQTAEGVEYAEKDMQVPTFSVGRSTSRRRSSMQSVDSTDSMSQILSDPSLWKEFQQRMKDSKCLTGFTANTKEVLRQLIEEKGLDEEELKEDEFVSTSSYSCILCFCVTAVLNLSRSCREDPTCCGKVVHERFWNFTFLSIYLISHTKFSLILFN